jgi:hypothetical protein
LTLKKGTLAGRRTHRSSQSTNPANESNGLDPRRSRRRNTSTSPDRSIISPGDATAEIRAGAAANSVDYGPHTGAERGGRGTRITLLGREEPAAGEGRRKKELLGSRSVYLPANSAPARRRGLLFIVRDYCILFGFYSYRARRRVLCVAWRGARRLHCRRRFARKFVPRWLGKRLIWSPVCPRHLLLTSI